MCLEDADRDLLDIDGYYRDRGGEFIVYDKEGRAAWYLPDPRDMDRKILERVLKRLREQLADNLE